MPTIKPQGPCNKPWKGNAIKSLRPEPKACANPPGDPRISKEPTTHPEEIIFQ